METSNLYTFYPAGHFTGMADKRTGQVGSEFVCQLAELEFRSDRSSAQSDRTLLELRFSPDFWTFLHTILFPTEV